MSGNQQGRGPRVVKGAIVAVAAGDATPTTISFQYNPATLRRTVTPQMVGGESHDRSEMVRFTGAPIEVITLDVHIDAIDALGSGESLAVSSGIAPQLAALALLAYPSSSAVTNRHQLLSQGTLEIAPITAPSVQLVFGPKRVLPIRLQNVEITEEAFDTQLNPIRATVGLTMRVLTYSDVSSSEPAYADFLSYQQSLESMAAQINQGPPT